MMRWWFVFAALSLLCVACGGGDSGEGRDRSQIDGRGGSGGSGGAGGAGGEGGSDEAIWLEPASSIVVPLHGHVEASLSIDRDITGAGDVLLDLRAPLPPGVRVGASATDAESLPAITIPAEKSEVRLFFFAGREVEALGESTWKVAARSEGWSGTANVTFRVAAWVTNAEDAGDGSLRDMVESAPRLQERPTIGFAPWAFTRETTIALESPLLLTASMAIEGPVGATGPLVTLDGQDRTRILQAGREEDATPHDIEIEGLQLKRGRADTDGLCIRSHANLRLELVVVSECRAADLGTVGGGLYAAEGTRTVIFNARFESNATTEGGAIYLAGWADISGATFAKNEALGGGAIAIVGSAIASDGAPVHLRFVEFEENEASFGGAIFMRGATSVLVAEARFTGNRSQGDGGAIGAVADESGVAGQLRIERSTFRGNRARQGGALFGERATLSVVESTFDGNEAVPMGASDPLDPPDPEDHRGGAIHWDGSAALERSLFGVNRAGRGGAIHARGHFTMHACSVIENRAEEWAGGLDLVGIEDGEIRHSTIAANEALLGGGVYVHLKSEMRIAFTTIVANRATGIGDEDGSTVRDGPVGGLALANADLELRATVIAGNASTGDTARDLWVEPDRPGSSSVATLVSFHQNFIGDRKGGGKLETEGPLPSEWNIVGDTSGGGVPLDPMLGALVEHDERTWVAIPAAESPLVDAMRADDALCEGADQRGIPRPSGGGCDIGAVELE